MTKQRHENTTWRYLSGHSLDGRHRTDASWLHWGTTCLNPVPVVRWHYMPRLYRAAVRTGLVVVPAAFAYGYATARTLTLAAAGALAAAGLGLAGWWLWRKLHHFRHQWRYVRPLRRALAPILEGAPPRVWVPPDRSQAKIWLPPAFTGTDKEWEQIARALHAKLALEAPDRHPQLQGPHPYALYTRSETSPGL